MSSQKRTLNTLKFIQDKEVLKIIHQLTREMEIKEENWGPDDSEQNFKNLILNKLIFQLVRKKE